MRSCEVFAPAESDFGVRLSPRSSIYSANRYGPWVWVCPPLTECGLGRVTLWHDAQQVCPCISPATF